MTYQVLVDGQVVKTVEGAYNVSSWIEENLEPGTTFCLLDADTERIVGSGTVKEYEGSGL